MTTFPSFFATPTAPTAADLNTIDGATIEAGLDRGEALLKTDLNAKGYEKAERHRGNAQALENLLNRVMRGYLVDERNDDDRRERHEQRTDEQTLALRKQVEEARTRIRQINETEVPALESTIQTLSEEILQIRKDEAAGLRDPNHLDRVKLRLYGMATVLATVFVYLIYVSSFYSAFFRDIANELRLAGPTGQTAALSAIFSRQAFAILDFHWAGPLLLFTFGIGLHILWEVPGRWGKIALGMLLTVVLATDGLIAYFVEDKIHEMKIMMGMDNATDAHRWWMSPVFWLVIALGFVAALAWSLVLHAWMKEVGKKDVSRLTALDIRHRLDQQQTLRTQIAALKAQLLELEGQIARAELDIEALDANRQAVVFSPSELEKYVTDFYDGWLTYVNNRMSNAPSLRAECDAVMRAFRAQHLTESAAPTMEQDVAAAATPVAPMLARVVGLLALLTTGWLSAPLSTLAAPVPAPKNYVVLLDLSDRLLTPDQARRDVALVQAVFARFEGQVRQQQIIFSNDCFRVVVAPQRGIAYRPAEFEDALYLDMATLRMDDKRKRLDALRADLPRQLGRLYALAMAGKRHPHDFAGCDLWQYVNEQLPTDLRPDADNRLVILTDGYLDFEANPRAIRKGNRATDSRMLDRLRRDPQWRQTLARPTEGLLPVPKSFSNLRVCVAEVRPKVDNLEEADLLTALWDKWLREMRVRGWAVQGSQPKALAMMQAFLSKP